MFREEVFCDGRVIVLTIEGSVFNSGGGDDLMVRRVLAATEVSLTRDDRSEWRGTAAMITPTDSVLEARLKNVEIALAHIAGIAAPEGSPERRMREALERLGWKPPEVLDHRRLALPLDVRRTQRLSVEVKRPKELECDVVWSCTLSGLQETTRL